MMLRLCLLILSVATAVESACNFPDAWVANQWWMRNHEEGSNYFFVYDYADQRLRISTVIAGVEVAILRQTVTDACNVFVGAADSTEITYSYPSGDSYVCVYERIHNNGAAILRKYASSDSAFTEETCADALANVQTFYYAPKYGDAVEFELVDCPVSATTYDVSYFNFADTTHECENDPTSTGDVSGSTLTFNLCDGTTIVCHCVAAIDSSEMSVEASAVLFTSAWPVDLLSTVFYCARYDQTISELYITTPSAPGFTAQIKCDMSRSYENLYTEGLSATYTTYQLIDNTWEAGNPVYVSFSLDADFAADIGDQADAFATVFLPQVAEDAGVTEDRIASLSVLENEDGTILVEFVILPARGPGEPLAADAEATIQAAVENCPYELTGPADEVLGTQCDSFFSYTIPDGGPCESNPCMNGGTCSDVSEGTLECGCVDGYSGTLCENDDTASTSFTLESDYGDAVGSDPAALEQAILEQLAEAAGVPEDQLQVEISEDADGNIQVDVTTFPSDAITAQDLADDIDGLASTCGAEFTGLNSETLYITDCYDGPNFNLDGAYEDVVGSDEVALEQTLLDQLAEAAGVSPDEITINVSQDGADSVFVEVVASQEISDAIAAAVSSCTLDLTDHNGQPLIISQCIDPCDPNPCDNGGTCSGDPGADASCECTAGFQGETCDELDPCFPNPCNNGGTCTDAGEGSTNCDCAPGFQGNTCDDEDPCDPNPCENGGTCMEAGDGSTTCTCAAGYMGDMCADEDPCDPNPCQNGDCSVADGEADCTCEPGYEGDLCETEIPGDPCDPNPCNEGGVCTDGICDCPDGFQGATCQIVDPCSPDPCDNGGECSDEGSGDYSCSCPEGFEGDTCEDVVTVDPCSPDPCDNGGECSDDGSGDYSCSCPEGYEGDTCEDVVTDTCDPNPCINNGNCTDLGNGGFSCVCSVGFSGTTCAQAQSGDGSGSSDANFFGLVISICIVAAVIMAIVIALVIYNFNPKKGAPRKRLTWEEDYSTLGSSNAGLI